MTREAPSGSSRIPKLTRHKASGRAVVRLNGRDHYCGVWGTRAAGREYDRLIAQFLGNGRQLPGEGQAPMIVELVVGYMRWAKTYYRKNGKPTSEIDLLCHAFKPLKRLFGRELGADFSPSKLKAVRHTFVERDLARKTCNEHTSRVKRLFRWAVECELVPPDVYHALTAVRGLRKGRGEARETAPIRPVPDAVFEKTLTKLGPHVAAICRLLILTGARVGEIVQMRVGDIDMQGEVWEYWPASHKTEHHGAERVIFLGRQAQDIVRPFLKADPSAIVFQPRDAVRNRSQTLRDERVSSVTPSQRKRGEGTDPARRVGDAYTPHSIRRAVVRACDRAEVPRWHPHQLRHNAATRLRADADLEVAQVMLGHRRLSTTQVYAQRPFGKAREFARIHG